MDAVRKLIVDLGERSYPIYIGEGILKQLGQYFTQLGISKKSPVLIVTDDQVAPLYLDSVQEYLRQGGYQTSAHIVPAGEKSKSLAVLEGIVGTALHDGLDRRSTVIALGGGVVGDLAGFVAASFMRGVKFVQIPTTILAHDSSVGGKVAVNHPLAKNIIGAFYQPTMVVYDTDTLQSLPEREVRAGLAEVIKHGLIWNENFVKWCDEHAEALLNKEPMALQSALYEGCKVKSMVVAEDETEQGLRAILNLGHTIGHALEAVAGYDELLHGEAIAIGMIGSALLAEKLGYSAEIKLETERIFKKFELPIRIPMHYNLEEVLSAMMHDKKFVHGTMVFVIPEAIGKVSVVNDIPVELVQEVLQQLKQEEDE